MRTMTEEQKRRILADPIAKAKVSVVNELRGAIAADAISGVSSAALSAAGGSKSWSKMSLAERVAAFELLKKDLNAYLSRTFGVVDAPRPNIAHVRTVRCR